MSTTEHSVPLTGSALRHRLVHRLMTDIFRGVSPEGTRLVAQKLAGQYGISATPVREALLELAAAGLVDIIHNRGAVVAPFGPRQLRELYQIRRILECEAVRCACGQVPADELDDLQRELDEVAAGDGRGDWAQREMAVDRRLHATIAASSGSSRLVVEIDRYNALMQVVRELVENTRQAQRNAVDEHLAILGAMRENRPDAAVAEMARHIQRTATDAQRALFLED